MRGKSDAHFNLVAAYGTIILSSILAGFYLFGCDQHNPRNKEVNIV